MTFEPAVVCGVDFSGARLAGRTTWVASLAVGDRVELVNLQRLDMLCGQAERAAALGALVGMIRASDAALWALDFPFGMPVEVMAEGARWADQFAFLAEWGEDGYGAGLECLRRGRGHIRRATDREEQAPFDPYHYRIIYQTFHGMRDVLGPLRRDPETAILPFHYRRLGSARRALVEACPASTLRRLGLPHQNYKQPEGGPLTAKRWRARAELLRGLRRQVGLPAAAQREMMADPGADAIDAVVAGVGALRSWRETDHRQVRRCPRYRREGRLYV